MEQRSSRLRRAINRNKGFEETAKALGVSAHTLRRWTRDTDIPHQTIIGPGKRYLYDIEEVKRWRIGSASVGEVRSSDPRVPVARLKEAVARVKKQLSWGYLRLADYLEVPRMTFGGYLYKPQKVNTVPATLISQIELLLASPPEESKKLTKGEITAALQKAKGSKTRAAVILKISRQRLTTYIKKYSLDHLLTSYDAASRVTKRQLEQILKETGGNIKAIAAKIGTKSRGSVYKVLKQAKLDPKQYRYPSKNEVVEALRHTEGRRVAAAKYLKIGPDLLKKCLLRYRLNQRFPITKLTRRKVKKALQETKGRTAEAARTLGVTLSWLNKFIHKHGLLIR